MRDDSAEALDRFRQLAEHLRCVAEELGPHVAPPDAGVTGADDAGHVEVVFGPRGDLQDVHLDAGWLARTQPAAVSAAITATLRATQQRSLAHYEQLTAELDAAAARLIGTVAS